MESPQPPRTYREKEDSHSTKKKKGISVLTERRVGKHHRSNSNLKYISLTSRIRQEQINKREICLIVRRKDDQKDLNATSPATINFNTILAKKLIFEGSRQGVKNVPITLGKQLKSPQSKASNLQAK